jgi:hypothetical protein
MGDCVTAAAIDKKNLIGLTDRPGDIKARLLIALTALYVERASHTEEEKRQYAELAQRLIDAVDATTRATVAGILRNHPTAPIDISERFSETASSGSANLPTTAGAQIPAAVSASDPVAVLPSNDTRAPAEWGEPFFAATAGERRKLLELIAKSCEGRSPAATQDIAQADYERLDAAALQGRIGEFIREFERLFDLPRSLCERIVNDPLGEPIVVAATAAHMPIAVLQRILLLVNPAVGHSVERVFDLTNLAYELDRGAAVRLMSLWRDEARRNEGAWPLAARFPASAAERERPALGLRARFGALSQRIQERSVTSRSDRESAVRRDLRSR